MANDITIPDSADVEGMTPDEYRKDLKRRYYTERYADAEHVQEVDARIQKLRDAAEDARADAEALVQKAEAKRQEAKEAVVEGEDADPLFDAAAELEQKAERKRSVAEAKEEAADELEDGEKADALQEDEELRTDALRTERRERIEEMLTALEEFEERFQKVKAVDERTSDAAAYAQKLLSGVDLTTQKSNGARTELGDQIRRKVDGIPA